MYNKIIVIDAGHGGKDSGAVGNGLYEKTINLSVALKVKDKLNKIGFKNVYLTRSDDRFLELLDRTTFSNNKKADIFISIHCNSASNKDAVGVETYCYNISNNKLAKEVQAGILATGAYNRDRKVKEAGYYVLKNTIAKACLVELAFISNVNDSSILKNKQEELSNGIVNGVCNYYGIKASVNNPSTSGGYRVVLASFKDKANAEKLKNDAVNKGFKDTFLVYDKDLKI